MTAFPGLTTGDCTQKTEIARNVWLRVIEPMASAFPTDLGRRHFSGRSRGFPTE
ncbi:hypothetical protein [Lyngbya sp. CCY1209]|uniref:hypothetical protein n=1 Tax=Lyngbya sp. CCY1209 TaxID=2886103 RepID=UPI002D20017F|nr:hypothetical protein [Lyngbya sp. CCY1209]MEB3883462.1 hypothetical protein [Lyngbya sp. CCY1209]